jgi:hypothetical protein
MATEKELRQAIREVRKLAKELGAPYKGLLKELDGVEDSLGTPGTRAAKRITEQPLPTGQIPSEKKDKGGTV